MSSKEKSICAVMLGRAPNEEGAEEYLRFTRPCPYVAAVQRAGDTVMALYVLPEAKRWWIEVPAQQPDLLGLEQAQVLFAQDGLASSAWSRGEARPTAAEPPCRSSCATCPFYRVRCQGCPASRFFLGEENAK